MWVRNTWYVAAWSHEVAGDQVLARTIMNEPLVLYRAGSGSVVAMEDRCCHRLAPLSLGRREGDDLRCMYHGMKFGPDGDPGDGGGPGLSGGGTGQLALCLDG